MKRQLSLILSVLLLITALPFNVNASSNINNEPKESDVKYVRENGKDYIVIPVKSSDIKVSGDKKRTKGGVNFRKITPNTPAKDGAGQLVTAAAAISWETDDWDFPTNEGFKADMLIAEGPRENTVIATAQVKQPASSPAETGTINTQFTTTEDYKVGDEKGKISIRFENKIRGNARVQYGDSVNNIAEGRVYFLIVTQISMPIYTSEWYDNSKDTRPVVKGKIISGGDDEQEINLPKENFVLGSVTDMEPRYIDENYMIEEGNSKSGQLIGMEDFSPLVGKISEDQLKMSKGQNAIATGKFVSYVTKEIDPSDFSATETEHKLDNTSGKIESHAITSLGGNPGKKSPAYFYQLIGDNNHMWRFQMREVLAVKLNSGAGKVGEADNKELHVGGKDSQEIGHSEKIYNNDVELTDYIRKLYPKKAGETDEQLKKRVSEATQSQRVINFDTDEKVTPPKVTVDGTEVDTVFKGWATKPQTLEDVQNSKINGQLLVNADKTLTADGKEFKFTDATTTLYRVYEPKGVGKVKFAYVDAAGKRIDAKYKFISDQAGKDVDEKTKEKLTLVTKYPADKNGTEGDTIEAALASTAKAPSFLGYEVTGVEVTPAAEASKTQTYTKDGKYTITYKYRKLDSVIPEKDGDKTNEKPDGYVTVTFHADDEKHAGDKQRGKVYKTDKNVEEDKIVYFVNPKDEIMLSNKDNEVENQDFKLFANVKPDGIKGYKKAEGLQFKDAQDTLSTLKVLISDAQESYDFYAQYAEKDKVVKLDDPENPTNFPKDPDDNSKKDAAYVTVKFVADENGMIKEGESVKENGIAYAVLKNTEWADAVKAGVVVPTEFKSDKFYSFKEWQRDGTKVTTFPKVTEDVTYTAVFGKADELTVTYNLNAPEGLTVGGEAPTDEAKYLKDEEVTVKALTGDNKLAGYKFNGWNTQADGKGTAYDAGAKFAIKANTKLFAQWEKTAKDVIPVDNKTDEKGKNGEEIPANYVFVEFKVKDTDTEKANIKEGQQAKFKVDPKAEVTLTAPVLEVKDAFKDSHTANFNTADYTKKTFSKDTEIFANVSKLGEVKITYEFISGTSGKALPKDIKFESEGYPTTAYKGSTVKVPAKPEQTVVEVKDANGDKLGKWTFSGWTPKTDQIADTKDIDFKGTWIFTPADKSDDPIINPVKPGDKKIEGKGKPGSKVKVTIPGVEKPIEVDVNEKGDWTVEVPKDKKLKDGDVIKAKQKTPGLPESNEVTRKVEGDTPAEPKNYDGYINLEPVGEQEAKHATDIHVIYLYGYQDKTVHPQGDMTRAEAAAMVARLKNLDMSDTSKPDFKDCESRWYNSAINAVVKAGLMKGYPDGTFAPNGKITRAEFAQLIKGIDNPNMAELPFTDVAGHWGLDAISQAYANKRIMGYPDNTFKPNNDITRAEAVTILNSLFDRGINEAGLANVRKDIVEFKDLDRSHWAYYQIIEASNTHEFYRAKDGEVPEVWVRVLKTWNDFLK